jgi:hypothetical protein
MAVPTLGGAQLWADRRWRSGWRVQQNVLTGHHRLLDPRDRRHAVGTLATCEAALDRGAPRDVGCGEPVVVLHGLGRSRRSMAAMTASLADAGFLPVVLDYPSTRRGIGAHVEQVIEVLTHLEGSSEGRRRVSFVTHSLGGIVARGVLGHPAFPDHLVPGRMVMCAPPNRGASLARTLDGRLSPIFAAIMGPSGSELAAGVAVPVPTIPFLVVAGQRGTSLNPLIGSPDDGVVAVEETKLEGMTEHLVVDAIHTFVMQHPETRAATVRFLSAQHHPPTGS